jgi:hypothetical protein
MVRGSAAALALIVTREERFFNKRGALFDARPDEE